MTSPTFSSANASRSYARFDLAVELSIDGEKREAIRAKLYRVSVGLAELKSPVYLPRNQKVDLLCDGRAIPARVAYCRREDGGGFDLALRINSESGFRRELRTSINLETSLQVIGSPGRFIVRVVDLSPSGVGFELPVPLPLGARVCIALGPSTALGEVRHCAPAGQNQRAGMRLEKLIRCEDAAARIWMDLELGTENNAILAAFERSVEERQSRSESILLSLAD